MLNTYLWIAGGIGVVMGIAVAGIATSVARCWIIGRLESGKTRRVRPGSLADLALGFRAEDEQ